MVLDSASFEFSNKSEINVKILKAKHMLFFQENDNYSYLLHAIQLYSLRDKRS
jgi:hypothetical protein